MYPYEKLTEQDKKLIEDYINWFGPNDASNMDWTYWAGLPAILSTWDTNKQTLFELFGEELILKRFFSYKQSEDGLIRDFNLHMLDSEFQNFNFWYMRNIRNNANAVFEVERNTANYWWLSKFSEIEDSFSAASLASNSYKGENVKLIFSDGSIFKICQGMKPMKIIHKLFEKFGKPEDMTIYENLRLWHSRLLNQKTVDGELCLSIHPLDYMTMSDNDSNWSSCMRWTSKCGNESDPGDYRAGTIDCLNSPYIVVAYLHNPNRPFKLDDEEWEWNNKRWRELFIVNEGSITEIKGYPYQDENLTNACLMWIKELANKNFGWTYEDEEVNMREPLPIEDNKELHFDFIKSPYMYKDIGTLNKHAGRINKKVLIEKFRSPFNHSYDFNDKMIFIDIPYGGSPTCMCCGQPIEEENREKAVMCGRCDSITTCGCCGAPIYCDDDTYWVEDSDLPMCYNCWCEETTMDELTEESHMTENMTELWLLKGYNEDQEPIFYRGKTLWVFEPHYNYEYQRLFTERPKVYDGRQGYREYVDSTMVADDHFYDFMTVFQITDDELYEDIYYLPNMDLAYPEDEED